MSSVYGYSIFVRPNPTFGRIGIRYANGTTIFHKKRRKFRCFVDKWGHLYLTINHNKYQPSPSWEEFSSSKDPEKWEKPPFGTSAAKLKLIPAIRAVDVRGLIWVRIHFGKWVFHLYRADAGYGIPIDVRRFKFTNKGIEK